MSKFKVSLRQLIEEFELETLHLPKDPEKRFIENTDVTRPSLQLAGYTDVFDNTRIQVVGKTEISYLKHLEELDGDTRLVSERCDRFFALQPPIVIICHDLACEEYILQAAQRHDVPLARSSIDTCEFISTMIYYLNRSLAPRITRHGVLMEIYGEGILVLGESGIGKSETAVELIARGHRLIADDAVEIRRVSSRSLVGSSPRNIRHFMELRGIGIINARRVFGTGSVKVKQSIDLIIRLEAWNDAARYDRFGNVREYMEIMGVRVPVLTIPVKPGRNVAVIIEAATMNFRLDRMGYNATRELMRGLGLPEEEDPPVERVIHDSGWDLD